MADVNNQGALQRLASVRRISRRWLLQEAYLRAHSRAAAAALLGVSHQALDLAVGGEALQEATFLIPKRGNYWLGYDKDTDTDQYDDERWLRESLDKTAANLIRFLALNGWSMPEVEQAIREFKQKA